MQCRLDLEARISAARGRFAGREQGRLEYRTPRSPETRKAKDASRPSNAGCWRRGTWGCWAGMRSESEWQAGLMRPPAIHRPAPAGCYLREAAVRSGRAKHLAPTASSAHARERIRAPERDRRRSDK